MKAPHMKKTIHPKPLEAWSHEIPDQHAENSLGIIMSDEELIKAYIDKHTDSGSRQLMLKTLERKGHGKKKDIQQQLDPMREPAAPITG